MRTSSWLRAVLWAIVGSLATASWPASADAAPRSRWTLQPTPNPAGATYSRLIAVACPSAGFCAAVGSYTTAEGVSAVLAEEWDSSSWILQSPPEPAGASTGNLSGVSCVSRVLCRAVGYYTGASGTAATLVEQWDGTSWSIQPSPNPAGAVYSYFGGVSCKSATSCIAVGAFRDRRGRLGLLIERLTGGRWLIDRPPRPTGASELFGVSCAAPRACTAVGDVVDAGGRYSPLVLRWSGQRWSRPRIRVPAGASDATLVGVSCPASRSCTSVGYYTGSAGRNLTLAEGWNGRGWSVTPTGNLATARGSELFALSCPSSTFCTAAGNFADHAGAFVALAERLARGRWNLQPTAADPSATNSGFDGVSCPTPSWCVAVGYVTSAQGVATTLAERFS